MNIEELYQEIILDHSKRPRNFGQLPDATTTARGDNPSCGDEVEIFVKLAGHEIERVNFIGHGCAICMASASLMTLAAAGRPLTEMTDLIRAFQKMLTSAEPNEPPESLGNLLVFAAVRHFPQRVKCATLAWHALGQALSSASDTPDPAA